MEIKPCPFCGGPADYNSYRDLVECQRNYPECGIDGPRRSTKRKAIEAWNAWGVKNQPAGTSSGTEPTR